MPVYTFSTRNRGASLLVGLLVLGAGVGLLVVGLAVLAGIAIVGGVLGTGIVAYRALRGQRPTPLERSRSTTELDPSLEVFAQPRTIAPNEHSDG
jgi:hypothetical protein